MVTFWIVGITLTAVGFVRVWRRTGMDDAQPRWLVIVHEAAAAGVWLAAGAFCVLVATGFTIDRTPTAVMVLIGVGAAGLTWASNRLLERIRTSKSGTLSSLVQVEVSRTVNALRRGLNIVAPTGWREFQVGLATLDRAFSAGSMVKGYLVAILVVLPSLLALTFVMVVYTGPSFQRDLLGHLAGYNALAMLASITATLVVTVVVTVILRGANVLRVRLDFGRMFAVIATCTGYGTAVGVVTVALLPIMAAIMPNVRPGNEPAVIAPRLLLDVPAAFALIGYLFGTICASVALCRSADNLVIRRLLTPAVFAGALLTMFRVGAGPESVFRNLTADRDGRAMTDCSDTAVAKLVDDPEGLFRAYLTCGDGTYQVTDTAFGQGALVVLAISAVWAFVRDFRQQAIATESSSSRPRSQRHELGNPGETTQA